MVKREEASNNVFPNNSPFFPPRPSHRSHTTQRDGVGGFAAAWEGGHRVLPGRRLKAALAQDRLLIHPPSRALARLLKTALFRASLSYMKHSFTTFSICGEQFSHFKLKSIAFFVWEYEGT